jgi:hypothetical protein
MQAWPHEIDGFGIELVDVCSRQAKTIAQVMTANVD